MDILCLFCQEKIADYSGQIGFKIPIESQYYTRIDGTKPAHGSSTAAVCPFCKQNINELEAVLQAVENQLRGASKLAETEQYLAEKGHASSNDRT